MLTISIINYRNCRLTAEFVQEVISVCKGLDFRIVVRDNSETSELAELEEMLDGASGRVFFAASPKNPGFGAGHNLNFEMFEYTDADVFLIMNNDLHLPDPTIFGRMQECVSPSRIVTCTILLGNGREVWYSGGSLGRVSGDLRIHTDEFESPFRATDFVSGCCLMLSANLYRRLGGFDEQFFMYAEDLDFSVRARAAGVDLVVLKKKLIHEVGSGRNGVYTDLYLYENTKNRLICLRRFRFGLPWIRYLWFVAKYGLARSVQLALYSKRPVHQMKAAWRGIIDGALESAFREPVRQRNE